MRRFACQIFAALPVWFAPGWVVCAAQALCGMAWPDCGEFELDVKVGQLADRLIGGGHQAGPSSRISNQAIFGHVCNIDRKI